MDVSQLQESEFQALGEVCAVGLQQAGSALAQLLGKPVHVMEPSLLTLAPAGLAQLVPGGPTTSLHLQIQGAVAGSIIILLTQEQTRHLLKQLLGQAPPLPAPLSDLEISALEEVGNILASAFLNGLGTTLEMPLLPSVPHLETGCAEEVLARALGHLPTGEPIVVIATQFVVGEEYCTGSILLAPATASLELILGQLPRR